MKETDGKIETISQGTGTEERLLTIAYYNTTDEVSGALKGEVSTIIDPMNRTVDFEYDLMGRVLKKTFEKSTADERVVEYSYDESGNVLTVKPAGKPVHNFYYDSVDLPDIYEAPLATGLTEEERRTEYTYNLDRQVEDIVRPDGTVIHLTYELTKEGYAQSTGKLQKITVPGRGDIELDYETTGGKKLSTVTTPEGDTLTYAYDGALMTDESWSGNVTGTVSRAYNNDFQTTAVTVGSNTTGYTYDNDGLLLSSGDMTITRDPDSGLVTGTALDSLTTTQTYNTFGEIETYDAGDYSYTIVSRDKLGRITEKDETIQGVITTNQYTYDKAGRLETVTENGLLTNQYTYDDNGNRTSKNGITATHNGQDQIIQDGYSSYTYTANGDLETKTNVLGTTTYTHDALGNLTQVNLPNNDVISYTYDGRNRRIAKMVNGTITERFVYQNQLKPAAKVDSNGDILEHYIYGTRINTPDYILKNGEQYRVISDERGSVKLVINASDGTISQKIDYDEFGNVITDTNPGFQPFYYAGGVYDLDTKLVKFGARDYDAVTGRWLQKEPLGFAGSDNFYSYCDGDPVNYFDVNGLTTVVITVEDGPIDHSAVFIGDPTSDDREAGMIYDPAGSFPRRSTIDVIRPKDYVDDHPNKLLLLEYVEFYLDSGADVYLQFFDTSEEDEARIRQKADELGKADPFTCTMSTSDTLRASDYFKDLPWFFFPSSLFDYLKTAKYK